MKKTIFLILLTILFGCSSHITTTVNSGVDIRYHIDVTNHEDDLFHVTVFTSGLTSENNIYNFAAPDGNRCNWP